MLSLEGMAMAAAERELITAVLPHAIPSLVPFIVD